MIATRRRVLGLLAGAPLLAAGVRAEAREPVIPGLIQQGREVGTLTQRIDFISRALLGTRYQGHTLIGSAQRKEVLVLRDDAFDCVTYCEAVLAASFARDYPDYQQILKRIRYAQGEVRWAERNHDFAQWSRSVVAKNFCRPLDMTPSITLDKRLDGNGLGKRRYEFPAFVTQRLVTHQKALQTGDVVGFVSRRSALDFFHTGFIAFNGRGVLMLRHASRSHGRVFDEDMKSFVARTGPQYVTLLRPQEQAAIQT